MKRQSVAANKNQAAGLCRQCGKPRTSDGATLARCGTCAKKQRTAWELRKATRRTPRKPSKAELISLLRAVTLEEMGGTPDLFAPLGGWEKYWEAVDSVLAGY